MSIDVDFYAYMNCKHYFVVSKIPESYIHSWKAEGADFFSIVFFGWSIRIIYVPFFTWFSIRSDTLEQLKLLQLKQIIEV